MCGIAGLFDLKTKTSTDEMHALVKRMTDSIMHRGPDGDGLWVNAENGIGLGHRRLSIIDLSKAGHQPMHSDCGRYVLTYNGEIYNGNELRQKLKALGRIFTGHSDTEVIVNAFAEWGVKETILKLVGMFAIATWDKSEKTFYLVRDRVGIKPIYWGIVNGGQLIFGSELRALLGSGLCSKSISKSAIASYLRFAYVPSPHSVYEDIYKLDPGCILTIKAGTSPVIDRYWDAASVAQIGKSNLVNASVAEIAVQLENLLKVAVKSQMAADVPLGAFLSGGIDSSLVVALMQEQSKRPVQTYCIGFDVPEFNEAEHAKAVAQHLGTAHTELYITSDKALDIIPKLGAMYDEPFGDSSQIPTYLLCELSKKNVTVALSGDGGDELFAGYNRYSWGAKLDRFSNQVPYPLRKMLSYLLQAPSSNLWDKVLSPLSGRYLPNMISDKIQKVAPLLGMNDTNEMYKKLVTHLENIIPGIQEKELESWSRAAAVTNLSFVEQMQLLDILTYMSDDILTKVDRASMATSLEVRVPFLDHRIIEYSWQIPEDLKIRNGQSKYQLRKILNGNLPKELIERPKSGFAVPIASWLRGPLKEWSYELLSRSFLYEELGLDRTMLFKKWEEHQSGHRNWQHQIWTVLMLASWHENWH